MLLGSENDEMMLNCSGDVSDDLAYFDVAESLTADTMLASASHGSDYSVLRLDRAQDDLNSFKKRIDANAEEQREHADLMAGLQRKVSQPIALHNYFGCILNKV